MGAFYPVVAVSSLIGTPIAGALIAGKDKQGYQGLISYAVCDSETDFNVDGGMSANICIIGRRAGCRGVGDDGESVAA